MKGFVAVNQAGTRKMYRRLRSLRWALSAAYCGKMLSPGGWCVDPECAKNQIIRRLDSLRYSGGVPLSLLAPKNIQEEVFSELRGWQLAIIVLLFLLATSVSAQMPQYRWVLPRD